MKTPVTVDDKPPHRHPLSAFVRLRIENFRSIRDEQTLSAVASGVAEQADVLLPLRNGPSVLPVVAIYGANASGKSTVIHALDFLRTAIGRSQRSWNPDGGIPREPFLLDTESRTRPSLFEAEVVIRGTRIVYGFVVDSERVLEEWLFAYPNKRKQEWFVRDNDDFKFGREFPGENAAIQRLTRPNSLFLSAAAQNNHERISPIAAWFTSRVRLVSSENREWHQRRTIDALLKRGDEHSVLRLMRMADIGVDEIQASRQELSDDIKAALIRLAEGDEAFMKKVTEDPFTSQIALRHTTGDGAGIFLPFDRESAGTRALFALAGPISRAITGGGVLLVDEIDSSLHPLIALELVRVFQQPETNPRRAQLIFNTHDTNLLDCSLLRRDQIWFTEKDRSGSTALYSLTDYHPRRDENVKRGYLQGRYGAVPFLTGAQSLGTTGSDDEKK